MTAWGGDPFQHRYFFHLELDGEVLSTWQHDETGGGKSEPIRFEFFWLHILDETSGLIAGHGQMISALIAKRYESIDE
jgi:hypothetical protein